MLYEGEISLHFDPPMGANWNSRQRAIVIQLDSWNYCMLAHLLSFLGIEEQSAVILNDEI